MSAGLVLAVATAFATVGSVLAEASTAALKLADRATMHAMDCHSASGQLWQIDLVTGDATPVGSAVPTA